MQMIAFAAAGVLTLTTFVTMRHRTPRHREEEDGVVTRTTGVQNVVSVSSSAAAAAEGPEASKSDAI